LNINYIVGKTYCQLGQIKLIQNTLSTHSKMKLAIIIILRWNIWKMWLNK